MLSLDDEKRAVALIEEKLLNRIGADLHDGPSQMLALSLMQLDTLMARHEHLESNLHVPDANDVRMMRNSLANIRGILAECLLDVRAISQGLQLPDIANLSLAEVIMTSVSNHELITETQVEVAIDDRLLRLIDPSLAVCAYRLIQEGLSNAYRHAGGVGQAVSASWDGSQVTIEVKDRGPGLASHNRQSVDAGPSTGRTRRVYCAGLGLNGLRERVKSLNGELIPSEGTADSDSQSGNRVIHRVPADQ